MDLQFDLHTHTTFSDGRDVSEMVRAAADAGLEGIGCTDHLPIGPDPFGREDRYDFSETYPERRSHLTSAAEKFDIHVFDGAEINYHPDREDEIAQFLEEASFDYTIGSVHYAASYYIAHPTLEDATMETRRDAIDTYLDWVIAMIDSGLFDVVGHLDLPLRSSQFHEVMRASDYERIAEALAESPSIPELNAGRVDQLGGSLHPDPEQLHHFEKRDISFVYGSDAHAGEQIIKRLETMTAQYPDLPVRMVDTPKSIESSLPD